MSTAPTADEMIPHTIEPHEVTGLYNGKLGIWLFLASEVMLFGALFSTYVLLRVGATDWPQGIEYLNVPLATLNTLILITSSVIGSIFPRPERLRVFADFAVIFAPAKIHRKAEPSPAIRAARPWCCRSPR